MKNLIIGLMATVLSLTLIPSVKADNVKPKIEMTTQVVDVRVKNTESNGRGNDMSFKEKRESKRQFRESKRNNYNNHRDGVIYIGGGTLLLIIILIILL